ncbi:hypothetical protein BC834DRAFT_909384 [Gloeopeniophorella convolvens]|nr:hypothetical protein BC834DRAFT_909384 [Gloeopeniophorella convolvens]
MSTDAPAKQTFVVWAPDYTDAEAFSRRLAIRAEHLEGIKQLVAGGWIKIGGALSDPETVGVDAKLNGSLLIVEDESVAAVRAVLAKDPYWTGNVWDKERVDIRTIAIGVNVK